MVIDICMNKIQFFGVILVAIGLFLLTVFPIFGIFQDEFIITFSIFGGWGIAVLGSAIILISLIYERLNDKKKENFDNNY